MYVGLRYTKITKFWNLRTLLIAIFMHAARKPAHSNGYDSSLNPHKKKNKLDTPVTKI